MNPASFIKIYFEYDDVRNKSKCIISDCRVLLSGKHTSNLEKHIMRKHPTEAEIIKKKRLQLKQDDLSDSCHNASASGSEERPLRTLRSRKRKYEETIHIAMNRKKLMQACAELITVNGRPFTFIEDSGFRQIIDPIIKSLNESHPNFNVDRQSITQEIHSKANNLRRDIMHDLKNRLVSIKIDTVTHMKCSVMEIDAQYIIDGELIIRNLCVKELPAEHSEIDLEEEIISELQKFDVQIKQLYSITVDNVVNLMKTINLLEVNSSRVENNSCLETSCDDENSLPWLKVEEEYKWTESAIENVHGKFKECGVFSQRCAAYTLQLAVRDFLSRDNTMNLLEAARSLCKALRTPPILSLVTQKNKTKPVLDCPTRWHSSLDMIESLLRLRDIFEDVLMHNEQISEIQNLTDEQWLDLQELAKTLTPSEIAMKSLQSERLLIGDFLQIWLRCKLETDAIGTTLAKTLVESMENSEKELFECPTITCALYLDPRWHIMLSFEQQAAAENYLAGLWNRLQNLQNDDNKTAINVNIDETKAATSEDCCNENSTQETVDPLEQLLQQREKAIALASLSPTKEDVRELIRNFKKSPRTPRSEDILQYWKQKSSRNPELYALSSVVLAVPATEVSVERMFSHLRYIPQYLRSDLTSDLISDILFVKCNHIFANKNKTTESLLQ